MEIDAKTILQKRVVAVLNLASGSADASSEAKMRAVFDAAGLTDASIVAVGAEEIAAALDEALTRADVLWCWAATARS